MADFVDQEEDWLWGGGGKDCLQHPQPKQRLPLPQESWKRGGRKKGEGGQERGECPLPHVIPLAADYIPARDLLGSE